MRSIKYKPHERIKGMNKFRTYVITKKSILKILLIIFAIIMAVAFINKIRNNKTVSVFSYNPEDIIREGTVNDNPNTTIDRISENILGFNIKDSESIIKSSSAGIKNAQTPSPSPVNTKEPEVTQTPEISPKEEIMVASNIRINNNTDYEVDANQLCSESLDFKLDLIEPEVLIVHTHTTECYDGDAMSGENERTTNEDYNMCEIGEIIALKLENYGIKTIHDKSIHDYPSYQGAYNRALKTIEKNINIYPSIKVVLDIHRDAYIYPDGSKLKLTTSINGEDVAQAMLVLGTDSMGLVHNNWQSNLKFASKIQNAAEIMYPGLMRPINLRRERFNMHMTPGSVLIEIGSNGNSLTEAKRSAEYIADAIAAVLLNS